MFNRLISFFATGPDKPLIKDGNLIKKLYNHKRSSVFISLVLGYGFLPDAPADERLEPEGDS